MENKPPEFDLDVREINYQEPTNGVEKIMLWFRESNILHLVILDHHVSVEYEFQVPNDKAMDAWKHPFTYKPEDCNGTEMA